MDDNKASKPELDWLGFWFRFLWGLEPLGAGAAKAQAPEQDGVPPDTLPADFFEEKKTEEEAPEERDWFAENAPPTAQPEPPAQEEINPDSSGWVN